MTMKEPEIITNHFHNKPMKLTSALYALAGQEGNDGDEGKVMQEAADYIRSLQKLLQEITDVATDEKIEGKDALRKIVELLG